MTILQMMGIGGTFLLSSCGTPHFPATESAEESLSQEAGRDGFLFVPVQSNAGEQLLFAVDTGSPVTILNEVAVTNLGPRLGATTLSAYWYGTNMTLHRYKAPALLLGQVRLRMGKDVLGTDLGLLWPKRRVAGILGMD